MGSTQHLRACLVAGLLWLGAVAQAAPATEAAQPPDVDAHALTEAWANVVGVQVRASPGAPSIETLGRQRAGTGIVIDADGLILTIGYLLLDAEVVDIVTSARQTLPARALAYDVATGLGLVQPLLPLTGMRAQALGSSAALQAGDWLVGVSAGHDMVVQITQLVGRRPFSGSWEYHLDHALYTSPPMGNHSGAPLFNLRGELLGVGSLLLDVSSDDAQALPGNLFVPVDLLAPVVEELRRTGSSRISHRPWLGLTLNDGEGRVEVVRVAQDSPAEAAALTPGDLLLAIDGVAVDSLEAFYKKLWDRAAPDAEIELTVRQRAGIRTLRLRGVDRASLIARRLAQSGGI